MPAFEYKIETWRETLSSLEQADTEKKLNKWGEEGWELVSCSPLDDPVRDANGFEVATFRYVLKRRL